MFHKIKIKKLIKYNDIDTKKAGLHYCCSAT